jgi:organic radical activating enzyme
LKINVPSKTFILSFQDFPTPEESIVVPICGCLFDCKDCFNKEVQNRNYGFEFQLEELLDSIIFQAERSRTKNLTLEGGDWLHPENIPALKMLLADNRFADYKICVYSGASLNDVKSIFISFYKENNKRVDYWKLGRFDVSKRRESKKTEREMIFASPNQEVYNSKFKRISKNGIIRFKRRKYDD